MRNNLTSNFEKIYSREEKRREEKSLIMPFCWHAQNCYAR